MNTNLPIWDYYPKDDSKFIDPMYVPYQDTLTYTKDGLCPINKWPKQNCVGSMVDPLREKRGWGRSFQLLHPDKDPCPEGWTKVNNGFCLANKPDYGNHGLYSEDAFVPKHQYWDGYAPRRVDFDKDHVGEFDMRSQNPYTGNLVKYFESRPVNTGRKYGRMPSKDSLIA